VFKVTSKRQVIKGDHRNPDIPECYPSAYTHGKHPDTGTSNHLKLSAPGADLKKPRSVYLTKYSSNHNHREFNGHRIWSCMITGGDWVPEFYGS